MTTEQLQYFLTIVDTGSFTEASLELNISQSALSKQIQSLENELGVQVFNRERRRVELTDEGKQLLPQVRHISEEFNELVDKAKKLRPDYKDKISIITLPFLSYCGLDMIISRFELENPQIVIYIKELEEPDMFPKMSGSNYDIAFTGWSEDLAPSVSLPTFLIVNSTYPSPFPLTDMRASPTLGIDS